MFTCMRSLSSCLCGLAVNCPATRGPGDRCAPEQFECLSDRTCIPASYHCDEEPDCPDRSDEYGCSKSGVSGRLRLIAATTFQHARLCGKPALIVVLAAPPTVTSTPEESVQAARGSTVTFTCQAVGVPTPIITWRLNWGHIPVSARWVVTSVLTETEPGGAGVFVMDLMEFYRL